MANVIVAPHPETQTPPVVASARLISLDAFRGFTMFWIVGGNTFVFGLLGLGQGGWLDAISNQLKHSAWEGLHCWDLIWPAFMFIAGVSVPFSVAKRARTESRGRLLLHALKRAAVLVVLGSIRGSVPARSPMLFELGGVLYPIGVAYLAAVLLAGRPIKLQLAAAATLLAGYAALLAPWSYQQGANLMYAVDMAVLGMSNKLGWGTLLVAIPAAASTLIGLVAGEILLRSGSTAAKCRGIAVLGGACLALGWAVGLFIPVIMKLWTSSYTLQATGWSCLVFLLFYWMIDVAGYRRWAFPFTVIGMNAIFIYMVTSLVHINQMTGVFTKGIAAHLGNFGAPFSAVCVLAVEWLILYWMYKRKIFIKA